MKKHIVKYHGHHFQLVRADDKHCNVLGLCCVYCALFATSGCSYRWSAFSEEEKRKHTCPLNHYYRRITDTLYVDLYKATGGKVFYIEGGPQ